MASSVVRADYDALRSMSQSFGRGAEEARQSLQRVRSQVAVLQGGDWKGTGATAFYQEMDSSVVPTLTRLVKALEQAQQVTLQISQIMKGAEDEAARCLTVQGGGAAAGNAPAAGGVAAGGAAGGSVGLGGAIGAVVGGVVGAVVGGPLGAAAGAALGAVAGQAVGEAVIGGSPAGGGGSGANNPLIVRDPASLFTDGNLRGMVGTAPRGSDTPALRSAMNELSQNPTGARLDGVLQNVADIRGRPVAEIRAEFDRFQAVRQQAEQIRRERGLEAIPAVDQADHASFVGSTPQMRFGQMVGDAFGIDPVFGSMLSPTGGMVGPGNNAYMPGNNSAIGYHGVAHDAAGYLYNYHGVGPGYDYLGREGVNTSNPLTGQVSGVRYWTETIYPRSSPVFGVADRAINFTRSSVDSVQRLANNVRIF